MPVLHVGAEPEDVPDAVLLAAAAAVADALALAPSDVLVRRVAGAVRDASGRAVPWATVLVQGRDRGPQADAAVAAAIRAVWPDDRVSIGAVRDLP